LNTIRASVLADLAGVSERRLRQLAEAKHIPAAKRGQYPTADTLRALFSYFRKHSGDLKTRAMQEQVRERKERADGKALSNAQLRRQLVPMSAAISACARWAIPIREAFLSLPGSQGPLCNPADPGHATATLQHWVDSTLPRIDPTKPKA